MHLPQPVFYYRYQKRIKRTSVPPVGEISEARRRRSPESACDRKLARVNGLHATSGMLILGASHTAQLYKLIIGYMPTSPLFSSRSRRLGFNCRSIWLETDFSCGTHTFCHCTSPLTKTRAILSMLAAIVPLIYFIELITP